MSEDKRSTRTVIELKDFPGEQVLSHEGTAWLTAATVALAPYELVAVAETGISPATAAIKDVDLTDFPELAPGDPDYERRKSERKKYLIENERNAEKRARITLRDWNTLFEALRSC